MTSGKRQTMQVISPSVCVQPRASAWKSWPSRDMPWCHWGRCLRAKSSGFTGEWKRGTFSCNVHLPVATVQTLTSIFMSFEVVVSDDF